MISYLLVIYFVLINTIALVMAVYDKLAAKNNNWRISEKALILTSILGGSVMMYITMRCINHKTQKPKFMIGIPIVFVIQLLILVFVLVKI